MVNYGIPKKFMEHAFSASNFCIILACTFLGCWCNWSNGHWRTWWCWGEHGSCRRFTKQCQKSWFWKNQGKMQTLCRIPVLGLPQRLYGGNALKQLLAYAINCHFIYFKINGFSYLYMLCLSGAVTIEEWSCCWLEYRRQHMGSCFEVVADYLICL